MSDEYPQYGYQQGSPPPSPPAAGRPWYRKLRFMLPIGVLGGLIVGSALGSAGSSSGQTGTTTAAATVTTTTTATGAAATVTKTAPAAAVKASIPPAVQAVLKAWTEAGPQPDKQHAAMAALKQQWPTLAEALEKATGVNAPKGAAAPAPAPGSATISGDGTYEVGTDIKPGTYKSPTPDSGNCYWARLRDDKNSINSIIDNNNSAGPSVVTIHSGDRIFETSGCNDWVRVR